MWDAGKGRSHIIFWARIGVLLLPGRIYIYSYKYAQLKILLHTYMWSWKMWKWKKLLSGGKIIFVLVRVDGLHQINLNGMCAFAEAQNVCIRMYAWLIVSGMMNGYLSVMRSALGFARVGLLNEYVELDGWTEINGPIVTWAPVVRQWENGHGTSFRQITNK